MNQARWFAGGSLAVLVALVIALAFWPSPKRELGDEPLTLFCAAGISEPVQRVIDEYEQEYGIEVQPVYDGSGKLLSSIRSYGGGDLYLAADRAYMVDANRYDLIAEIAPIAKQRPCLTIRADAAERLQISSLRDLLESEASLSIAEPKVAAISRVARKRLANENWGDQNAWDALWDRREVTRDTVNQVANDVQTGVVDVGIIWDATAAQRDDLKIIRIDAFEESPNEISIAVLRESKEPSRALHFMRYLTSRDVGLPHFEQSGYETVTGDVWEERPTLTLYTGGLMHPSLEESIDEFEDREQVDVIENPNGCGILVSQIRSGENPDVYFACDESFMTRVADRFQAPHTLTQTEMVIVVNRKFAARQSIESLQDLVATEMRIGLCSPEHSALGELTRKLLQRRQLWNQVEPRVLDWPSTADRLVEQVTLDALDAAIVYRANTTLRANELQVVGIDSDDATAMQPIAVSNESDFPQLSKRLIDKLRSDESRERFESRGFQWREEPESQ